MNRPCKLSPMSYDRVQMPTETCTCSLSPLCRWFPLLGLNGMVLRGEFWGKGSDARRRKKIEDGQKARVTQKPFSVLYKSPLNIFILSVLHTGGWHLDSNSNWPSLAALPYGRIEYSWGTISWINGAATVVESPSALANGDENAIPKDALPEVLGHLLFLKQHAVSENEHNDVV